MMQVAPLDDASSGRMTERSAPLPIRSGAGLDVGLTGLSPAMMAVHLLRADPSSARCFAQAMYEGSAWANEAWGDYWADVINLV